MSSPDQLPGVRALDFLGAVCSVMGTQSQPILGEHLSPIHLDEELHISVCPGVEARIHPYLVSLDGRKWVCGVLGISFRQKPPFQTEAEWFLPTEMQAWSCAERLLKHFASGNGKQAVLRLEESLPARLVLAVVIPLESLGDPARASAALSEAFACSA